MDINKEILVYSNVPFKKYRWVSYYSLAYGALILGNIIFLPLPRLLQERNQALANRVKKKPKDDSSQFDEFLVDPNYDPATVVERIKRLDYSEIFSFRNIINNITERPYVCISALAATVAVPSLFFLYVKRSIHEIILLPGGRVRFAFFSPTAFGKPSILELPLENVSCVASRKSKHNYTLLKFKGYRFYHLIQKPEGQFLEPKLFDKYLGYERAWAVKK